MAFAFTTLRHPVEKLLEAEHFLSRLADTDGLQFQFELNAFLSSSRSVTLLMQKAMSGVPGFSEWYDAQRDAMRSDEAMKFFITLRNVSQKEGPVAYVGGACLGGGWTYRFVSQNMQVPAELVAKDIAVACAEHLQKLAALVDGCASQFPFFACPVAALSDEGMACLGYGWADLECELGLPAGYIADVDCPTADKFEYLAREFEPLDRAAITRIANGRILGCEESLALRKQRVDGLLDAIAEALPAAPGNLRATYLGAIGQRIADLES